MHINQIERKEMENMSVSVFAIVVVVIPCVHCKCDLVFDIYICIAKPLTYDTKTLFTTAVQKEKKKMFFFGYFWLVAIIYCTTK